jgi:hypothetical protein
LQQGCEQRAIQSFLACEIVEDETIYCLASVPTTYITV